MPELRLQMFFSAVSVSAITSTYNTLVQSTARTLDGVVGILSLFEFRRGLYVTYDFVDAVSEISEWNNVGGQGEQARNTY
jgi:hypothetical protein